MHSRGMMHRDLKPENVLYKEGMYKIADLGSLRDITYNDLRYSTSVCTITYRFVPPPSPPPHLNYIVINNNNDNNIYMFMVMMTMMMMMNM